MSVQDPLMTTLVAASEVCFWVLLGSLLMFQVSRLLMKAASARLGDPPLTAKMEQATKDLEQSLLPVALLGCLGPAVVRFVSETGGAAWHLRLQALLSVVIWLGLMNLVAGRLTTRTLPPSAEPAPDAVGE